ncbi:LLM class flavin-dependent oxidoreductase [Corynebacterium gerontici]|uniref:Alkanal monooxygenase alpha chain n=1 Tax=Corynebacterium gerontici TaxID=2079234 RepID=A0A3G6J1K4_9CORY|nr:LLM class flavin-dependent oxidoreductase [Corynebacterium gerontici]AZA11905.1 Alkanal monooxygenase alpha chain [Corynebacterium gerontici]
MRYKTSLLEFATVYEGDSSREALRRIAKTAQLAEELGFHRLWFTEHHNIARVAAASPAVLIAHAAAHTEQIRLGSGGVMLPNHAPYTVAENFGTLEALHPGRIDLGVGRAPGTDPLTLGRALRRSPGAPNFDEDLQALMDFMDGRSPIPGVRCVPAAGSKVPVYLLGSSMYSAQLAARLGLPYVFASHFAPEHLDAALACYRAQFQPGAIDAPYVMAAMNVLCTNQPEHIEQVHEQHVKAFAGPHPNSRALALTMLTHSAFGNRAEVSEKVDTFMGRTQANELMLVSRAPDARTSESSIRASAEALG